jgi:hypothetical protein
MNPVTHFLTGWLVANVDNLERRDRALVTVPGVIPDIDGLGIVSAITSRDSVQGLSLYGEYHHVLAHNIFFGIFLTAVVFAVSKKKRLAAFLVLLSFHLHLIGDILSGRGPDGTIWTISYFYPFSDLQFSWAGQWELNAWPNVAVTAAALLLTLWLAWKRGFSPVGIFSLRADNIFVDTLRRRFPKRVR